MEKRNRLEATGRQRCRLCGRPDKFDFTLPLEIWRATVPAPFSNGVVCLFCFDGLAEMRGVDYAAHLTSLYFAGDRAAFEFKTIGAVSI